MTISFGELILYCGALVILFLEDHKAQTLETAVNTVNEISAEMADAIEFIEMGDK